MNDKWEAAKLKPGQSGNLSTVTLRDNPRRIPTTELQRIAKTMGAA